MSESSSKEALYRLISADPFISQQDLAERLGLSRSAVAGHIASLIREKRVLGRAYVLPERRAFVVIGGANLDRKLRTRAPLRMGTSNPVSMSESFGGVARNIAENLARLGAAVRLITATGDDAAGQALLQHAEAAGIDTGAVLKIPGAASGTYTAVLDADGEMQLALAHMDLCDALDTDFLSTRAPQRADACMTVADLNLPAASVATLVEDARSGGAPLVLVAVSEPKMARLPRDLRGVRLLILNAGELQAWLGRPLPPSELAAACGELQAAGVQDVIVTRGAAGVCHTGADDLRSLPAPQVNVTDVTGAGDAFAAAVCWSLQRDGDDLDLACRRGLALAALTMQSQASVRADLAPSKLQQLLQADALA